jgi:hypothetical protein
MLIGDCLSGCSSAISVNYLYRVFKNTGSDTNMIWTPLTTTEDNIVGIKTDKELTISSDLFAALPSIMYYKVDCFIEVKFNFRL